MAAFLYDAGDNPENELEQGLSQDARVDRVKGMTTEALTDQDRSEIIDQARDFMSTREIAQSTLAKMIGVSGTVLSEVLGEKYAGDTDAVLRKIPQAINEYYRSEDSPGKGAFVRTRVAESIFTAMRYASKFKKMVAIYAPSGVGKSFCVQSLLETEFRSGVYLEIDDTCRNPRDLYIALCKLLRIRCYSGTPKVAELAEAIISKMKNSGRMIVLDEADGLALNSFNTIRQLWDKTKCPICLVGRPNLAGKIEKTAERADIGASACRRVVGHFHLDEDGEGSGGGGTNGWICTTAEMASLVKRLKVTFTPESIRWLCTLAHVTALLAIEQKEAGGLALSLDVAELSSVVYGGRSINIPMLEAALAKIRGKRWAASISAAVHASMNKQPQRTAATA